MTPRPPEDPNQPHFDAAEAAHYCRFKTVGAFRQTVCRYGIPSLKSGKRRKLYRRIDLDKFLARGAR